MVSTFNWIEFLQNNGVRFRESGPNTSAGNIVVHCPFCGSADESEHMSISINGKGWRCWRQPEHRGRSPVRLVQALLGCSWDEAGAIVGVRRSTVGLLDRVKALLSPPVKSAPSTSLTFPDTFKPIDRTKPSCEPYVRYLERRGFKVTVIDGLTKRYGLRYCTRGAFSGRIVFPVVDGGKLVTWTGRSIHKDAAARYKTLTTDPDMAKQEGLPVALDNISHHLLWYDDVMRSPVDTVILTEGPFDVLKLNVLAAGRAVATCFFTAAPSAAQIALLHVVLLRFKHRVLLPDRGMQPLALEIARALRAVPVRVVYLPPGVKDPGDLDTATFNVLAKSIWPH